MNPLSYITTPIELHKNNKPISYGTGFYYLSKWDNFEGIFLVTNYHVLTGNDPNQRDLSPKGDFIIFYYHIEDKNPSAVVGVKIPLFTSSGKPIWISHSNSAVDIALIPITFSLPFTPEWKVVNKKLIEVDMDISPADNITLIGYPRMFFDKKNALPIYKTGSIASEYEYDFNGDPCFIIDVSAFNGNSGSPVFSIRKNAQIVSERIIIKAPGSTTKFLGVYSAGIVDHDYFLPIKQIRTEQGIVTDLDMQLGVVWKANLIDEMLNQNNFLEYEKIGKELVKEEGFKFKVSKGLSLN